MMKALEQIERLITMNSLIKAHKTGSPDQFSKRMNISRRQLFSYMEFFREFGVELEYSKSLNSYYYSNGHELNIIFNMEKVPASRFNFLQPIRGLKAKGCFSPLKDKSLQ